MLIMENTELDKCWSYGEFRKNFHVVPIKPLTEAELNYVLEKLISWHLNTKTFSSEYLSIVPLLANASQEIFKIFQKVVFIWLRIYRLFLAIGSTVALYHSFS